MITQHEKDKEFFEHIIQNSDMEHIEFKTDRFDGIAYVKTYEYSTQYEYKKHNKPNIDNIFIRYSKWFVEEYEYVKDMELKGTEKHNKLVSGSGVYVSSSKSGKPTIYTFYGKHAMDLINACERGM